jgi:adenosylhomocysteine nucleosidase
MGCSDPPLPAGGWGRGAGGVGGRSRSEPSARIVTAAPRPGPLLLVVAVDFEARLLARRLGLAERLSPPGPASEPARPGLVLRRIGVAGAELPRLDPALAALRPSGVLVAGLAGGCAPDVRTGDILVGSRVGSAGDPTWLTPDGDLERRALAVLAGAGLTHWVGPLLTVGEIVATPGAKADCWRSHGALAVDMESAHVLRWARKAGLPALAVRAVADGPADVLPPALLRGIDAAGCVRPAAVLGWVTRPSLAGAAWRTWRRSRTALDQLARFLAAFTTPRP